MKSDEYLNVDYNFLKNLEYDLEIILKSISKNDLIYAAYTLGVIASTIIDKLNEIEEYELQDDKEDQGQDDI